MKATIKRNLPSVIGFSQLIMMVGISCYFGYPALGAGLAAGYALSLVVGAFMMVHGT